MKLGFTVAGIFLFLNLNIAQNLERAEFIETVTAQEISALIGIPIAYDVDLYKMLYHTPNIKGEDHIASGLVCIPQSETLRFPMACYQHGTVSGRNDVPSRLAGGYQLPLLFAALGYVTCAPDFLGLGDSPGIHPYVHADSEAWVALDMIRAVKEMSLSDDYPEFYIHDQLFIGGYSQGGHASMALHRLIEEQYSDEITVTAAAHMSGPYSISEKMMDFTLGDEQYQTVSYIGWLILAYKEVYEELLSDISLEDVFKAQYIADIEKFGNEEINLTELNARLSQILINDVGAVIPKAMLNDNVVDSLLNNPEYPFSKALSLNDTYDWAPEAPTNLYYCVGDEQVTYENAILAEEVMRQNGSTKVFAIQSDGAIELNHSQCIAPVLGAVNFFFDFYSQLLSSNSEIELNKDIKLHYYDGQIYLELPNEIEGERFDLRIYSLDGAVVFSKVVEKGISIHAVDLPIASLYVTNILSNRGVIYSNKIVKP